jgi:divalent metal cation (Fe/Co/Zn/Cd) transporter
MIHLVFAALRATGLAHLGTQLTDAVGKLGTTRHFANRQGAQIGAIAIKLDASHHLFDVLFVEALAGAVFAGNHALITGLDAFFVLLV